MLLGIEQQLNALERQRLTLLRHVGRYSATQQSFRPTAESWSMADVVQHLVLVEDAVVPQLLAAAGGRAPRLATRLRYVLMLALFGTGARIKAPVAAIVPREHVPLDELRERWDATRARLRLHLEALSPERSAVTAFRHPRVGWLTTPQTLGFLGAHVRHHQRQIGRIERAPGFPAA